MLEATSEVWVLSITYFQNIGLCNHRLQEHRHTHQQIFTSLEIHNLPILGHENYAGPSQEAKEFADTYNRSIAASWA